jgi:hypothetical protein
MRKKIPVKYPIGSIVKKSDESFLERQDGYSAAEIYYIVAAHSNPSSAYSNNGKIAHARCMNGPNKDKVFYIYENNLVLADIDIKETSENENSST